LFLKWKNIKFFSALLAFSKMFSPAVLTGTVITAAPRGRSLHATVSIISVYKEGTLAIQQAGKNMSAKVIVVCKQCPPLRRGKGESLLGARRENES
jgi:hypothetical protein